MSIANIMVPLDLAPASWDWLTIARSIAERLSAQLVGVSACEALPNHLYGKGALINARIIDYGSARASAKLAQVESVFLARTQDMPSVAWRARRATCGWFWRSRRAWRISSCSAAQIPTMAKAGVPHSRPAN